MFRRVDCRPPCNRVVSPPFRQHFARSPDDAICPSLSANVFHLHDSGSFFSLLLVGRRRPARGTPSPPSPCATLSGSWYLTVGCHLDQSGSSSTSPVRFPFLSGHQTSYVSFASDIETCQISAARTHAGDGCVDVRVYIYIVGANFCSLELD